MLGIKSESLYHDVCNQSAHPEEHLGIKSGTVDSHKQKTFPDMEKVDVVDVEYMVLVDNNFRKQIQYCLKYLIPLVKVLWLVDGDVRQCVIYINISIGQRSKLMLTSTMSRHDIKDCGKSLVNSKNSNCTNFLIRHLVSQPQVRMNHSLKL